MIHQKKAFLSEKGGHQGVMSEESQRNKVDSEVSPYHTEHQRDLSFQLEKMRDQHMT